MNAHDRAQLQRVAHNARAILSMPGVPWAEVRMAQQLGRAAEHMLGMDRCGRQAPPFVDEPEPPRAA